MRILGLSAENIQRLSAVQIKPDGSSVVIVAGENEAGKSTCLDAIEMALGGEKRIPPKPVRDGQQKGKVVVDLGDLIVTRTFTAGGGTSLVVTNRDGAKYPSPQSLLDGLYGKLSFDPLAFCNAKPDEQNAILRRMAQINTGDLETKRQDAYDERTAVNRDLKKAQAALDQAPTHADVGTEPEGFEALTKQLDNADKLADASAKADLAFSSANSAKTAAERRLNLATKAVDEARAKLEAAEQEHENASMALQMAEDERTAAGDRAIAAKKAVPDRAALRAQITAIQARNQKVEQNRARLRMVDTVKELQDKAADLSSTITRLDAQKAERLASAQFPIDGLGLSDTGVTWNGLPFEQASTAIRTRVSVAIGAALNPKLKVLLIRNGNDLGETNLKLLATFADEHGLQLWIERIAGGNGLQTIVIEDGSVREPVTA